MHSEQDTPAPLTGYLLVESKGPWAGPAFARFLWDARELAASGQPVRLLLVQDGVFAAVPGAPADAGAAADCGAEIWVDGWSLAQRGLAEAELLAGARVVEMSEVSAQVLEPAVKVVWH